MNLSGRLVRHGAPAHRHRHLSFSQRSMCAVVLLLAACAHGPSGGAPDGAAALRWQAWASRVEALPVCLAMEWGNVPAVSPSFAAGEPVHVRGHLRLIELAQVCNDELSERVLWLPNPDSTSAMTLPEVDQAVGRSERMTCGSVLGLRVGLNDLAIEGPLSPLRVWRENDVLVMGTISSVHRSLAIVTPDRVCRAAGPPLVRDVAPETGERWQLFDGLERLAATPEVSRTRRAQALRVLFKLSLTRDRRRAQRAAEQLASEFGDQSLLE